MYPCSLQRLVFEVLDARGLSHRQLRRCQVCDTLNRLTFSYGTSRRATSEREKAYCAMCKAPIAEEKCLSIQVVLIAGNGAA